MKLLLLTGDRQSAVKINVNILQLSVKCCIVRGHFIESQSLKFSVGNRFSETALLFMTCPSGAKEEVV